MNFPCCHMTKPSPLPIQFFQSSWEGMFALTDQPLRSPLRGGDKAPGAPPWAGRAGQFSRGFSTAPPLPVPASFPLWLLEVPPGHPWQPPCAVKAGMESKILPVITRPRMTGENESLCFHQSREKREDGKSGLLPKETKIVKKKKKNKTNGAYAPWN